MSNYITKANETKLLWIFVLHNEVHEVEISFTVDQSTSYRISAGSFN